jgi:hypothetical protein
MFRRIIFCTLFFTAVTAFSQSRKRNFIQRELGFFGGASYYIGDINTRRHFLANHPALGAFFRYSTNYRYAFRLGFNYGSISGNDAASGEPDQIERNINFRSKIYEAYSIAEFNFVEYRIGHDRFRFTFFIFAGLGGYMFDPASNAGMGYQPVRSLQTEGKKYPKYQLAVPFGVGIKWTLTDKIGMGLEWGPRRTFTDYLDDVSGTYPEHVTNGGGFTDRTTNGSAKPGGMRGNPRTRDWYFFYGLSLSIKLPDPHRQCHSGR